MRKSISLMIFTVFFLFFMPTVVFAQRGGARDRGETLEVRLASPMPRNSAWGRTIDRIAAEWSRVTRNEVRVRVIHDGVEGGDAKMLSSLSANNIQAALFTSFGIAEICKPVMTLSVPFLIADDAELDLVLEDVLPVLEDQINRTDFVVVAWSKGGWINIFSKDPVFVPEDLRRHKVATNAESVDMNLAFKTIGFNLVEAASFNDIGTKIANGVVNAVYQNPASVFPFGLHKTLKNMLDIPIAPFMGALVIHRAVWNKIKPEYQQELLRATQRIASDFDSSMPKTVDSAISMMQRDGLKVNEPSPAQVEMWREDVRRAMPSLLGTTFDRDVYQRITATLEESRGGGR